VFAHQRDQGAVCIPHDIFDWWAVHLGNGFLLLYVVQDGRRGRAENEPSGTTVKGLIRLDGRFDRFCDAIRKVAYLDKLHRNQSMLPLQMHADIPGTFCSRRQTCFSPQKWHYARFSASYRQTNP
jgi:hypothetical protein